MRFILKLILSVIVASALGVGSAMLSAGRIAAANTVRNGPWRVNLLAGSTEAGLYSRFAVARRGLLALNRRETIYFLATADSQGRPLTGRCDYVLNGGRIPALWWSITAYGEDLYLIDNVRNRYSFSGNTLLPEGALNFTLSVSPLRRPEPWLPVKEGQRFSLLLRLYNPDPAVTANPAGADLPEIRREGCL